MGENMRKEYASLEYLKKHKILELLENITACLMFERPEKPKDFMISYIKKLIDSRAAKIDYPCLFDSSNIECLFGMLNPSNCGYVTFEQYQSAFKAVGAKMVDGNSFEAVNDEVSFGMFLTKINTGLSKASATFAAPRLD